MKIALKYGIAVTVLIAAWVALKHFVLHLQGPGAQFADVVIFNLAAITGLTLGIREKRTATGGMLRFGDGLITGIKIAVTYAVLTSAYFAVLLAAVGPKLMQQEGETSMVKAFFGGLDRVCFDRNSLLGIHRTGPEKILRVAFREEKYQEF